MISRISENGRRYVSDFIWPGEFIGLLNERKSAYSATALETTQICRHSHAQLSASISNSLKLAQRLLIRKNDELSVSQNHAMVLGLGTAKAKLAHFLIALQERQGVLRNKIISRVDLPMRRTDISDHLGMTPETLSREFQQLVREKLIISIPKGAMILARDTLIGITEAD